METVFEFNITKKELDALRIAQSNKKEYLENNSTPTILMDLAVLFKIRNDEEKTKFYLRKAASLIKEMV